MMRYQAPPSRGGTTILSDNERMLVACLQVIAQRSAVETRRMPEPEALQAAAREVFTAVNELGGVSQGFAVETARYLGEEVRRRRHR